MLQFIDEPGRHYDPVLANKSEEWAGFVAEPLRAGVVGSQERSSAVTGVLLARRKSGTLRLDTEARRSYLLFLTPPSGRNSSTECWHRSH